MPNIFDQLNQLDEEITSEFKPAITGGIHTLFWYQEEAIIIPFKNRGLIIPILAEISNQEYEYSLIVSKDLSTRIMKKEIQLMSETDAQNIKQKIKSQKQQKHQAKLGNIRYYLTEKQTRLIKNMDHPVY